MVKRINTLSATSYGPSDVFFLDTNVILYLHHPPSTNSNISKAGAYSNFIARLRQSGCSLRISSFNVQEAFHIVETLAFKNYKSANANATRKTFRKQSRNQVGTMQSAMWSQLKGNYSIENALADKSMLESFIKNYVSHLYDPVDYLFAANYPTCNIITSDSDFSSDPAITVYTY